MKRLLFGVLVLAGLSACLSSGITALADNDIPINTVSPPPPLSARDQKQMADEIKQGQDAANDVVKSAKLVKDKAENDRVDGIGQRLAAIANTTQIPAGYGNDHVFPFVWHFHIVEDKSVNAFSLPGGQVYINSGLLKDVRSDDELAGVLGHEMTHSAHHHIQALSHEQSKMSTAMMAGLLAAIIAHVPASDIGNLAAGAQYTQLGIMNTKYSQSAERDADHGGTIMMQKAGFDPVGMLTFMRRLGDFENASPKFDMGILQDHPEAADRVVSIGQELTEMNVPVTVSAIRKVTDAPHALARQDPAGGIDIVFNNHTLPTLADPDGSRIPAIVNRFNTSLDSGLQLYQVEVSGSQVLLSDRPLITILPADVALHPGETPQALAQAATDALRSGIYAQSFTSNKL
ncbi:MAG: M48 family metalloprotease [Janthinobacterium lividum]